MVLEQLITLSLILLIGNTCAKIRTSPNQSQLTYILTPEELETFIEVKRSVNSSYYPFIEPQTSSARSEYVYNQSMPKTRKTKAPRVRKTPPQNRYAHKKHIPGTKYPTSGDTLADCIEHDDIFIKWKKYRFGWLSAKCNLPGESVDFNLTCSAEYSAFPHYNWWWRTDPMEFEHVCPEGTVCIDHKSKAGTVLGASDSQDVFCQKSSELNIEEHAAVATKSPRSEAAPDWCLSAIVPGLTYPATPYATSFVLTEEVSWANGSEYIAPELYIRDHPNYFTKGFDRAYQRDTNLVSAELSIGSVRGRLQSRAVQFCMKMLTGGEVWTVMMYTWFKHGHGPRYRGRIPPAAADKVGLVETK